MILVLVFLYYFISNLFGGSSMHNVSNLYSVTKNDRFPFESVSNTLKIPYFINDNTKRAASQNK